MMLIAFACVSTMLLYAIPGYLMIRTKLLKADHIPAFAKLLLFVSQPCLMVYSVRQCDNSKEGLANLALSLLMVLLICGTALGIAFLILNKRSAENVHLRIANLACYMGNFGFMGVPILNALLPDNPEIVAYSAMGSLVLNIMGWTVGTAIITRDIKYMRIKKLFLNPAMISTLLGLVLLLVNASFPDRIEDMIHLLSQMSTPLCMLILGMRLGTVKWGIVFGRWQLYPVIVVKQLLVPALAWCLFLLLPLDSVMEKAIFIMMCCPVASNVLNFAELAGEGQETAAGLVLLGTSLSALTIPLMTLLL